METQITLPGTHPSLSVRLLKNGEKFLLLSFNYAFPGKEGNVVCLLSRMEAFSLWNFLDEALEESPVKEIPPRK
jgi:hypothetical protein